MTDKLFPDRRRQHSTLHILLHAGTSSVGYPNYSSTFEASVLLVHRLALQPREALRKEMKKAWKKFLSQVANKVRIPLLWRSTTIAQRRREAGIRLQPDDSPPTLPISELMRILLDYAGLEWDET